MAYTAIDDPTLYFNTKLYTGTGSSNAVTGVNFLPAFTWIKSRTTYSDHILTDVARGVTKTLHTNSTAAQTTEAQDLKSFDSDGFTVGTNNNVNKSSDNMVAWNWKGGTTSGIATNGSTTITPSAYSFNQDAGFSIIKYTGNSTSGAKIAHGLGVAPDVMIVKATNAAYEWPFYHSSLGATKLIQLQSTAAASTSSVAWNNTEPDSVNFTVQANNRTNTGSVYVGYMFAEKQGYSKFGSYIGNGNVDGAFVYTGFKPALIIIKNSAGTDNWWIIDNKRSPFNQVEIALLPNENNVESTSDVDLDITSQGFKILSSSGRTNASGNKYIYMAFAENPFVASNFNAATAR